MSVIGSNILAGASGQGGGYNLTKSLRFRSSASAYLNRTPASAGNRKTWTWSAWVKRGNLTQANGSAIFNQGGVSSNYTLARFDSSDRLDFQSYGASSYNFQKVSTAVYRDPSAWYHIVFVLDATNTQARIYVNGSEVTYTTNTNPANADQPFNQASLNRIGYTTDNVAPFDGYLAEVNFIDGQALTPSSFGETSTTTGVWIPKKYTGTYGTNGFYLPFTDTTSTSTLGTDFSGNSNTWTVNNISLTSGSTYDSMNDVPTLTSATTANYCVLNPLTNVGIGTVSNGNLQLVTSTNSRTMTGSMALPSTGQYYFEITATDYVTDGGTNLGIVNEAFIPTTPSNGSWLGISTYNASYQNGTSTDTNNLTGANATQDGDIWCFAIDVTNNKFWVGRSRSGSLTWADGVTPAVNGSGATTISLPTGTLYPMAYRGGSFNETYNFNFGQQPFAQTPPTGFVALNTYNLPTPTIGATASSQANKYFNAVPYSGDGTTNKTITTGLQSDFVWIKRRDSATSHILFDVIRGAGKTLYSHLTNAEVDNGSYYVQQFNSDNFRLGTGGDAADNANGGSYASWVWKANGTGVSNTAGSISAQVSANTTSGFSIVTYTGNGTSGATVGHGLGVAPSVIFAKVRSRGGDSWHSYHIALGGTQGILLNATNAASTDSGFWNNTNPSSSVFTVGTYNTFNTQTYVAYCWAEVAGFSKFGSYTGNGSTDGPFVHLGFRPKFVMIKRSDSADDWIMMDSSRSTYNVAILTLYANGSYAEDSNVTNRAEDFLSNGFKIRSSPTYLNASGGTYIYMAFAENPFKNALAR